MKTRIFPFIPQPLFPQTSRQSSFFLCSSVLLFWFLV